MLLLVNILPCLSLYVNTCLSKSVSTGVNPAIANWSCGICPCCCCTLATPPNKDAPTPPAAFVT